MRYLIWPILFLIFSFSLFAEDAIKGKVTNPARVYTTPSNSSEPMGTYPEGAKVLIESKSDNGWYRITLTKKYKGQNYGFIRSENVTMVIEDKKKLSIANSKDQVKSNYWLALGGSSQIISSSQLETAAGNYTISAFAVGQSMTFGKNDVFRNTSIGAELAHSSFTGEITGLGTFTSSWTQLNAIAFYKLYANKGFQARGQAILGLAMTKVTLESTTQSINASLNIPDFGMGLTLDYKITERWGISGDAIYSFLKLSSVPIILNPTINPVVGMVNLNFSGPLFKGYITYTF